MSPENRSQLTMKYNGPKDRLEAANSTKTTPEELAELANSEYSFVQAAVAANTNTPTDVLEKLLPINLLKNCDCEIILGLLRNQNLPARLFSKIEALIESVASNISPRDYYQSEIVKTFASSPIAPLEAILPLANPSVIPKHLRSRIANSKTRPELLRTLINDPSEKISRMAAKALNEII